MKRLLCLALLLSLLLVFVSVGAESGISVDPEKTAHKEGEADLMVGKWNLALHSTVNENGQTMILSSNVFKLLGFNFMRLNINEDGSAEQIKTSVDFTNYEINDSSVAGNWQKGENGAEIIMEDGSSYSCALEENTDYLDCMDTAGAKWTFERYIEKPSEDLFVPKPNAVRAGSEADFYGLWRQKYIYDTEDSDFYQRENGTCIMHAEYQTYASIMQGKIYMEIENTRVLGPSKISLQNGKLYTNFIGSLNEDILFELNDNGMLSVTYGDGFVHYYVKEENYSPDGKKNLPLPVLKASSQEVPAGKRVEINADAPGADSIIVYVVDTPVKYEGMGGSLLCAYNSHDPKTVTFYAEASYNGFILRSNEESVHFTDGPVNNTLQESTHAAPAIRLKKIGNSDGSPSDDLYVKCPEQTGSGEIFLFEIQPLTNSDNYYIVVYGPSREIIFEQNINSAGIYEFGPLPEGKNIVIFEGGPYIEHYLPVMVTAGDSPVGEIYLWKENFNGEGSDKEPAPINLGTAELSGFSDSAGGQTKVQTNDSVSAPTAEPADTAVTETAPVSDDIRLTVSSNTVKVGGSVTISVSAPGADGIRVYRNGKLRKQAEGDSLEYSVTYDKMPSNPEETFYAEASYNGVWSSAQSNTETVTCAN